MWLGKYINNKNRSQKLKKVTSLTRFLDVYLPYDKKGKDHENVTIEIKQELCEY